MEINENTFNTVLQYKIITYEKLYIYRKILNTRNLIALGKKKNIESGKNKLKHLQP